MLSPFVIPALRSDTVKPTTPLAKLFVFDRDKILRELNQSILELVFLFLTFKKMYGYFNIGMSFSIKTDFCFFVFVE